MKIFGKAIGSAEAQDDVIRRTRKGGVIVTMREAEILGMLYRVVEHHDAVANGNCIEVEPAREMLRKYNMEVR